MYSVTKQTDVQWQPAARACRICSRSSSSSCRTASASCLGLLFKPINTTQFAIPFPLSHFPSFRLESVLALRVFQVSGGEAFFRSSAAGCQMPKAPSNANTPAATLRRQCPKYLQQHRATRALQTAGFQLVFMRLQLTQMLLKASFAYLTKTQHKS